MSASYRALRLNLGVDDSPGRQLLMSADNWRSLEADAPREGFPVLGIDLGGSVSMSAACVLLAPKAVASGGSRGIPLFGP